MTKLPLRTPYVLVGQSGGGNLNIGCAARHPQRVAVVSMLCAILTAVFFTVVSNHLLVLLGSRSPHLTAFARSMAGAFTATMLISATLRGVIGHLVRVEDEPLPGLDVLRYSTALNYTVLGVVAMGTFALFVLSMAVLVLRTGVFGRWLGFVGVGCGLITLGAVVALMGAFAVPVAILWALCTAVAVWLGTSTTPAQSTELPKLTGAGSQR